MKILITGAGGMLGSDLAFCLEKDHEVTGIARHRSPHLKIPFLELDLTDPDTFNSVLDKIKPEVIFHAAAKTDVDDCERHPSEAELFNATMTRDVAQACKERNIFLVFFSTDYVFDGEKKDPYCELDPVCPKNQYGKSKAKAEKYIQDINPAYAIFRISWLYGKYGKSFPRTLLEKGTSQKVFRVVNDQKGTPTLTQDIAQVMETLCRDWTLYKSKLQGQIFHLANQGQTDWCAFASFIFQKAHYREVIVEPISSQELKRPAERPSNSLFDQSKVFDTLGLRLRPWPSAVEQFINNFIAEKHDHSQ